MTFSYQLYSSRNFGPVPETLSMVAELGYAQVEPFGQLLATDDAVDQLAQSLAETELTMPTAHMGLDFVRAAPARVIAIAQTLGIETIFVPHTTDQSRDAAGWAAFGAELAAAAQPIWDAGLRFGWHNHDFEFGDLGGPHKPLDLILSASDDLVLELDIAWVHVAGENPADWIAKYASRIAAAHIKDVAAPGTCTDEDGWADVGHGVLPWPDLMRALRQTAAQTLVIEHDNPSDDRRFAERSLAAAQQLLGRQP